MENNVAGQLTPLQLHQSTANERLHCSLEHPIKAKLSENANTLLKVREETRKPPLNQTLFLTWRRFLGINAS